MHRHLQMIRLVAPPERLPRPAKVVQLEARRRARLEAARPERDRPRPAA
jgi:hypothetical protein